MGELHSLLPVSEKVRNPVQHPRWELIIPKLGHKNGMVYKNNRFLKVKKHHVHCRTVTVSILIPVVKHADLGMHSAVFWERPTLVLVSFCKDGRLDVAVNDKLFPNFRKN